MSKITDEMVEAAIAAFHSDYADSSDVSGVQSWRAAIEAALSQGEAVAEPNGKLVAWWNGITPGYDGQGNWSIRWGAEAENSAHDIPLYDGYNPIHYQQPAPQSEPISDELAEALAVGDGTMEGALQYWHQRALAAEAAQSEPAVELSGLAAWWRNRAGPWDQVIKKNPENIAAATALYECADELESALAATGKQSGSEALVQIGNNLRSLLNLAGQLPVREVVIRANMKDEINHALELLQAATASRETVGVEPVAVIGSDFTICWVGSGPIAPLVERNGIKKGSFLYAAPPAQGVDLGQFRANVAELLRSEFDLEAADPEDHRHDDGSAEADRIANKIASMIDQRDGEK